MRIAMIAIAGLLSTALTGIVLIGGPAPDGPTAHEAAPGSSVDQGSSFEILDRTQRVDSDGNEFYLDLDTHVIGVREIQATATWRDDIGDAYDGLQLSVRTAASRTPIVVGMLDPIAPISLPITHQQSDVPDMARSAWSFIVTPVGPDPLTFNDDVHLQVTGIAGTPQGTETAPGPSPSQLLQVQDVLLHSHQALYNATGDAVLGHNTAVKTYWLEEGARVEGDLRVTIELDEGYSLDGIRLSYQDAYGYGWTWQYPDARQGDTLHYFIEVDEREQDADIPTGLWRFGLAAGQSGGDLGLLHSTHGIARVPFTMTVTAV